MTRLETMARFDEPEETIRVTECDYCCNDLHSGDLVYRFNGDVFCNSDCLADAVSSLEEL